MADVVVVKPQDQSTVTTQTPSMVRRSGVAPDICGSQGLWMGYVCAPPGTSGAHHHGDAESGIYILKGRVRMHFGESLESGVDAEAGDFLHVPPHTVDTEPVELIVARDSADYLVVNVPDPRSGG